MRWTHPIPRRRFLGLLGGAAAAGAAAPLISSPFEGILGIPDAQAAAQAAFPMDAKLASRILLEAMRNGGSFADLYLEARTVTRVTLAEGAIESVEQTIASGCGVRTVDGDRTGYAFADSFEEEPLMAAARAAAAIAAGPGTPAPVRIAGAVSPPQRWVRCARSFDAVPEDERVAWCMRADAAARAADPAIRQVSIELGDEMFHMLLFNTDGLRVEDTLPLLYMRINVIAEKNGGRGTGMERLSRRQGAEQMDGDAAGRGGAEAARMALAMCEASPAPSGEMPVILGAGGGVMFHEAVGHGLEADAVYKGTSMFAGKVGEVVGSGRVSVVDTGALPDQRGSYNFDDEGTPPAQNLLIDKGVLRGFLSDRITATALKLPRTGNGRRQSYRFPPLVRMSNTYLEPGTDTIEEIIRETKSGLYARTLGGGEVDTTTGNFTFGVLEGYRIEDGKIAGPVRGANLVGNGPEIMKRIDRVGPDQKFWAGTCGKGQWVPVSSGAPALRISSMTVGGAGRA